MKLCTKKAAVYATLVAGVSADRRDDMYGLKISQYREYVGEVVIYFKYPGQRFGCVQRLMEAQSSLYLSTWYEDENGNITNYEEIEYGLTNY